MFKNIDPAITAALIAAVTSTILTPIIQVITESFKHRKAYKTRIAPILEHIRILHEKLLQNPINPNMQGIEERIAVIEGFYDPIFNDLQKYGIKQDFINRAKHLAARHKYTRPWMEIEYPQEIEIFNNYTDRLLAVLHKKAIPKLFDPYE